MNDAHQEFNRLYCFILIYGFRCGYKGVRVCVCVFFQEATEGKGIDVIVEMLSNVNLSKDLQMLAYGGCVAVSMTFNTNMHCEDFF